MQTLARSGASTDLVLAKEGRGLLYYRFGLQYTPRNLDVEPLSRGFKVIGTSRTGPGGRRNRNGHSAIVPNLDARREVQLVDFRQ